MTNTATKEDTFYIDYVGPGIPCDWDTNKGSRSYVGCGVDSTHLINYGDGGSWVMFCDEHLHAQAKVLGITLVHRHDCPVGGSDVCEVEA